MRNFSIDIVWAKIQMAVAAIGGWLGYFLGGMDGLMIALIVFMILDYVTGLMCAVIDKKLSSAVGFKGICKKVLILMLVGVANVVDIHIVGTGSALRSAVICALKSRTRPNVSGVCTNAPKHGWSPNPSASRCSRTNDHSDGIA